MSEHNKTPWTVNGCTVIDANRKSVCNNGNSSVGDRGANMRRIVACVNACAGISTGNLELGGVLDTIRKERDELLAALLYVQKQVESGQDIPMSQINAAIRKAS